MDHSRRSWRCFWRKQSVANVEHGPILTELMRNQSDSLIVSDDLQNFPFFGGQLTATRTAAEDTPDTCGPAVFPVPLWNGEKLTILRSPSIAKSTANSLA